MLLHHKLADETHWDSLASRLELLGRDLRATWINVRLYESVVVAPKVGHATRLVRRYVEANLEAVVLASLTLVSVALGIIISGGF